MRRRKAEKSTTPKGVQSPAPWQLAGGLIDGWEPAGDGPIARALRGFREAVLGGKRPRSPTLMVDQRGERWRPPLYSADIFAHRADHLYWPAGDVAYQALIVGSEAAAFRATREAWHALWHAREAWELCEQSFERRSGRGRFKSVIETIDKSIGCLRSGYLEGLPVMRVEPASKRGRPHTEAHRQRVIAALICAPTGYSPQEIAGLVATRRPMDLGELSGDEMFELIGTEWWYELELSRDAIGEILRTASEYSLSEICDIMVHRYRWKMTKAAVTANIQAIQRADDKLPPVKRLLPHVRPSPRGPQGPAKYRNP